MLHFALIGASAMTCPAEHARYQQRHDPSVTAEFMAVAATPDWPSGLALEVRARGTPAVSWWVPWIGGTDNLLHLASTTDARAKGWQPPNPDGGPRPYGDRDYVGADSQYELSGTVPARGHPAPAHFLIPNAGSSHDAVFKVREWFDLIGCDRSGH